MNDRDNETVVIDRIGHRGDGIAETGEGAVYVPCSLPGEDVVIARDKTARNRARLIKVVKASPERTQPICRHFGHDAAAPCGGCSLQMMSPGANRALKRRFIADALAQHAIDCPFDETVGAGPGERRRAVLSARMTSGGPVLGYHARGSDRIADIGECPVLVREISGRLAGLRAIFDVLELSGGNARLTILAADKGLDVDIAPDGRKTRFGSLAAAGRLARLVPLCRDNRIARLTVDGELAVLLADPVLTIDAVRVTPQPAAFTQPTVSTETAMTGFVSAHLVDCKSVVDLFAGIGTFSFALARRSKVHAVELDQAALAALEQALRQASGLRSVTWERRDILRHPVGARELDAFAGLVFDPPRAGAVAQAREIAASGLRKVAAVSCNPATFARDSRILLDGGFALLRVVPVDQFVYSAETEIVGLFARRDRTK